MVVPNMPMLLAGRILQGAGAGCGVVLSRAIARDVYGQDRVAQVIAYLTAAYVLGPMVASPIGGQLTDVFGWPALFVLASIVGLLVIFGVPETRVRNAALPHGVFAGYKSLLRRPCFVGFMLQPGLLSAAFYTQATAASFLVAVGAGTYWPARKIRRILQLDIQAMIILSRHCCASSRSSPHLHDA